jgi:hypothetical protein
MAVHSDPPARHDCPVPHTFLEAIVGGVRKRAHRDCDGVLSERRVRPYPRRSLAVIENSAAIVGEGRRMAPSVGGLGSPS